MQLTDRQRDQPMNSRDEEIVRFRREGHTLQEIAEQFGMTRERVRQIVAKFDPALTSEIARGKRQQQLDSTTRMRNQKLKLEFISAWQLLRTADMETVCSKLDINEQEIKKVIPRIFLQVFAGNETRNLDKYFTWSEQDCIDAVAQAAKFHYPLRANEYSHLIATGTIHGPSVPLLFKRFGSWTAVCEAANVKHGNAYRDYDCTWTELDLKNFILEFAGLRLGAKDSWNDFCNWLDENGDGYPSPATIRNRLGGWRQLRSEAYLRLIDENGMDLVSWEI